MRSRAVLARRRIIITSSLRYTQYESTICAALYAIKERACDAAERCAKHHELCLLLLLLLLRHYWLQIRYVDMLRVLILLLPMQPIRRRHAAICRHAYFSHWSPALLLRHILPMARRAI